MTINVQEDNIKDSFYEMYLTEVLNKKDTIERLVRIPVEKITKANTVQN
tara:strand:- start:61 stop:207 length:147 start_codon:yes stop_codon:yes gene_type:complete